LAAYKEGGFPTWPNIRAAQLEALKLPYVGVASAQDLGDETGPAGAIHPRNKTYVGERLSYNMQHEVYGQSQVNLGPTIHDIVWPIDGTPVQSVILRFDGGLANNQGLILRDTSGCSLCCGNLTGSAVTVGTSNGMSVRAMTVASPMSYIVVATVDLTKTPGVNVVSVQHNWEAYPECALYNAANIPLLPTTTMKP